MFGGLTKTSSRIAIAAAFGLMLGGFALKATPAQAADLGGDCCADLEERVAELEATTVRKGNKKVSVTLSGWVVKTFNYWDDGDLDSAIVGDKGYDLGSRFALTGSATIAPGWSAGYNLTVLAGGDIFAQAGASANSNQFQEIGNSFGFVQTLYSYIYIKSDTLGTLNWGLLSPASDNPAVLADISGTVIESNAVWFEGASFFMRPKGAVIKGYGGLDSAIPWAAFLQCHGLGAGLGADCFGAAQPAVRYDSPTWGGFRFETSWGKQALTSGGCSLGDPYSCNPTPEYNFWDVAVFYTGDWNSIKLSAAAAYTWQESANNSGTFFTENGFPFNQPGSVHVGHCDKPGVFCHQDINSLSSSELFQVGASIMHKPSGLGIYGMYQHEEAGGRAAYLVGFDSFALNANPVIFSQSTPDTDVWYVKPFWRKAWSPIGATVLYGEYGNYNNQFSVFQSNFCGVFDDSFGTNIDTFCNTVGFAPWFSNSVFVTGSEIERYGLGVVQEIDSAAMHLFARWQHQEADVEFTGFYTDEDTGGTKSTKVKQGFDDWDLFQIGGVIFF